LVAVAQAQPKTHIRDKLYFANGQPATGRLTITWPAFTSNGQTVAAGKMFVNVSGGVLDLSLYANDTAIPSGTSYAVQYSYTTGGQSLEYWIVPTTTATVTVAAIRTTTVPTPNLQITPGQIGQGGAYADQCLVWTGTAWQPSSCAAGESNAGELQGRNISSSAPSGGMVLTWNATTVQWEPQASNPVITGDVSKAAGSSAATVVALQGQAVASTTPVVGQMMQWSGAQWQPVVVRYGFSFSAQTTVTVPGATHNMGTADLLVTCYDTSTPPQIVEPDSIQINPTAFDVTINFTIPQSGRCVLR
jgi:hypothetical protein